MLADDPFVIIISDSATVISRLGHFVASSKVTDIFDTPLVADE